MTKLDDFRLRLGAQEYVPLVIGGMGIDISTPRLALEAARLGGIGHLSDAGVLGVSDRHFKTRYVRDKWQAHRSSVSSMDKADVRFSVQAVREATRLLVARTMDAKVGPGGVFINVMEKLTMNAPRETLQARLVGAMDGGVDGMTLSAGLHLGSLDLIREHPRFREVKIGPIVSSARALGLFLKRARRADRMPDYIVVEGPLAGGHLGFGIDDWRQADLKAIVADVLAFLEREGLSIPVIPAGGIFTGTDAVDYLRKGAGAVQVATRFTIARECGLPDHVKQLYLAAEEHDIEVNTLSPTGYPMRMLRQSPAIASNLKPGCEAMGYLLDGKGNCSYLKAYHATPVDPLTGHRLPVMDRTCLCMHMTAYKVYTCGHYTYRLKETAHRLDSGDYVLPTAEHVFRDYQFSTDHRIAVQADAACDPDISERLALGDRPPGQAPAVAAATTRSAAHSPALAAPSVKGMPM